MPNLIQKLTNEIERLLLIKQVFLNLDKDKSSQINLEMVLWAIGSGVRLEEDISIGTIRVGLANKGWFSWQLGKPLSSQSPETVEKIGEILGI